MRSDAFTAVSDPTRRRILEVLAQGELPATTIAARFELTQPAISKHLRVLREAGLVSVRADGRLRWYSLDAAALAPVRDWLAVFEPFWVDRLEALGAHLRAKKRKRGLR